MKRKTKFKKFRKKFFTYIKKRQGVLLVIGGISLISMSGVHNLLKWNALRMDKKLLAAHEVSQTVTDLPHPTHIFIRWFVDVPIHDGLVNDNNWTIDDSAATYLSQSARPGYPGNIIIYGHNTRQILGNIRALKGYEKIKLTLSDGSERWYQVKELHQVNPDKIQFLEPTDTEVLTLYTCAGFADKDRFIVRAVPILE